MKRKRERERTESGLETAQLACLGLRERQRGVLSARPPPLANPSSAASRCCGRSISSSCRPRHQLPASVPTKLVMMPSLCLLLLCSFYLFPLQPARAQSISTSTPVPPLQWINLTDLLQGPSAPPLKDASIGYDNSTRTLIIFGGESHGGLPQQQTYLSVLPFLSFFALLKLSSVSLQSPSRHPHLDYPLTTKRVVFCITTPKKRRHRGW